MPRYFFHIRHPNSELIRNEEGGTFDGSGRARSEAVHGLCDLAVDISRHGHFALGLSTQIVDEDGNALEALSARETVSDR